MAHATREIWLDGLRGIAAVIDEGIGYEVAYGRGFAQPGVGEKGNTGINIAVRLPGGHSSVPSDHTSIGILSEIISKCDMGLRVSDKIAD